MTVLAPIHAGEVAGRVVRYFGSPAYASSRQPDMPWHAVDDLWAAVLPGRKAFDDVRRKVRGDWQDPVTVATPEGLVTIAPHYMAEGFLSAIEDSGIAPPDFPRLRGAYRNGCTQAFKKMTAHLDPMARMLVALSAMK